MRLWRYESQENYEEFETLSKKYKNYTHVKIEGICLNTNPEVDNLKKVEDLDIGDDDILLVELPKGKEWTFVPSSAATEEEKM